VDQPCTHIHTRTTALLQRHGVLSSRGSRAARPILSLLALATAAAIAVSPTRAGSRGDSVRADETNKYILLVRTHGADSSSWRPTVRRQSRRDKLPSTRRWANLQYTIHLLVVWMAGNAFVKAIFVFYCLSSACSLALFVEKLADWVPSFIHSFGNLASVSGGARLGCSSPTQPLQTATLR
jgi:hypothetical protein